MANDPIVCFETDYAKLDNDNITRQLFDKIAQIRSHFPNIAIVYSANNEQATLFYQGYATDTLPKLDGKGQCKLFKKVIKEIEQREVAESTRVLPIATSMVGGDNYGKNAVSEAILKRDLSNIREHLHQGWAVIFLVKPSEQIYPQQKKSSSTSKGNGYPYADIPKYLIGGGKSGSTHFYDDKNAKVVLTGTRYSQGEFVSYMLDQMITCYNSSDEQASIFALDNINQALLPPIITRDTFNYYLTGYVRNALVNTAHLSPAYANRVVRCKFSPSYNLRIICDARANTNMPLSHTIEKIINLLSQHGYGVDTLKSARDSQVAADKKIKEVKHQNDIISIKYDQAYSFLRHFCQIPLATIKQFYEQELHERRKLAPTEQINITAECIQYKRKEYTLKGFIDKGLSAKKLDASEAAKKVRQEIKKNKLYPENIRDSLMHIMKELADPQSNQQLLYRYLPIINDKDIALLLQKYDNKVDNLVMDCTDLLKQNTQGADPYFTNKVLTTIITTFNTLSDAAWKKYADLYPEYHRLGAIAFFDSKREVVSRKAVTHWGDQLGRFVAQDIKQNDCPVAFTFKFWVYLQVAMLAYVKGNYVLSFQIIGGLTSVSKGLYSAIKPTSSSWKFDFLSKLLNGTVQLNLQQQYFAMQGVCLPILFPYAKHSEFEQNREGEQKSLIESNLDNQLKPMLLEIYLTRMHYSQQIVVDNRLLGRVEGAAAKSSKLPKGFFATHADVIGACLNTLLPFSLEARLQQTVNNSFKLMRKQIDNSQKSDKILQKVLSNPTQAIPVDNAKDGGADTLINIALRAEEWELAHNILLFNLSALNTPIQGSQSLTTLLNHPERGEMFHNKAQNVVQQMIVMQPDELSQFNSASQTCANHLSIATQLEYDRLMAELDRDIAQGSGQHTSPSSSSSSSSSSSYPHSHSSSLVWQSGQSANLLSASGSPIHHRRFVEGEAASSSQDNKQVEGEARFI